MLLIAYEILNIIINKQRALKTQKIVKMVIRVFKLSVLGIIIRVLGFIIAAILEISIKTGQNKEIKLQIVTVEKTSFISAESLMKSDNIIYERLTMLTSAMIMIAMFLKYTLTIIGFIF